MIDCSPHCPQSAPSRNDCCASSGLQRPSCPNGACIISAAALASLCLVNDYCFLTPLLPQDSSAFPCATSSYDSTTNTLDGSSCSDAVYTVLISKSGTLGEGGTGSGTLGSGDGTGNPNIPPQNNSGPHKALSTQVRSLRDPPSNTHAHAQVYTRARAHMSTHFLASRRALEKNVYVPVFLVSFSPLNCFSIACFRFCSLPHFVPIRRFTCLHPFSLTSLLLPRPPLLLLPHCRR